MYKLIKSLLFQFDPETAHNMAFSALRLPGSASMAKACYALEDSKLERDVFGLTFKNPIGLAAGLDKNAVAFDTLGEMGFGFVEVGTVTPKPQPGNDKPRLFRLPADEGIINRMGFNNEGVDVMVERLKRRRTKTIVGGNIGKNKITPNEEAINDYDICFTKLFDVVDYFVVNVSSPNTPNLRELQDKKPLTDLLSHLQTLNHQKSSPKPILLKIAPDLNEAQIDDIVDIVGDTGIAGLIATNTTISRDGLTTPASDVDAMGMGGLSGKPVFEKSTDVIRRIAKVSNDRIDVIGVGGIHCPDDAIKKLDAGAKLVQLYTGFIYHGPPLVKSIKQALLAR